MRRAYFVVLMSLGAIAMPVSCSDSDSKDAERELSPQEKEFYQKPESLEKSQADALEAPAKPAPKPAPKRPEAKSAFVSPLGWDYEKCVSYFGPPRTRNFQGLGFSIVKDGYVLKIRLINEQAVCTKASYYYTDNERAFLAALNKGEANSEYRREFPPEALTKLVRLNGITAAGQDVGGGTMWVGNGLIASYVFNKILLIKPAPPGVGGN